jgi:small subunit ribosomal protein S8
MAALTDPIADLLTRIRNANRANHDQVEVPASKLKLEIVKILAEEKFIRSHQLIEDDKQGIIRIFLKYEGPRRERVITNLRRVSKPGLRVYSGCKSIPLVRGGMGITIVSTSQGVMTGRNARRKNIGGEVLCEVW